MITILIPMLFMLLPASMEVTQDVTKVEPKKDMEERILSEEGLEFLKEKEGVSSKIYNDVGHLAGGVGHRLTREERKVFKLGDPVSMEQTEKWLKSDVVKAERTVNNWVTKEITQKQFDSLVSLTFNIGENAFKRSTLLKKLNRNDFDGALMEFSKWRLCKGKVLKGLVARRAEEARMFMA